MTYETYYSDGGHGGPHATFRRAYAHALRTLRGSTSTHIVEIRPAASAAIGGYYPGNFTSFYVSNYKSFYRRE
jgi:hypothetical protein